MKIIGIVGSCRKDGNTDQAVSKVLEGAKAAGADVQKIYLKDYKIKDCTGCEGCAKTAKCVIKDGMQEIYPLLEKADGIVVGSPTYFYNVNGMTKCFLDRLYAYELFDKKDRSVWMGKFEKIGNFYSVSVAICEQESEEDLGFTALAISKTLEAVGYRNIDTVIGLHAFQKGEIKKNQAFMDKALYAGERLAKTIQLSQKKK